MILICCVNADTHAKTGRNGSENPVSNVDKTRHQITLLPIMEHTRIDEGQKRGPRKKPGPKPSSPRRDNGQFLNVLPNEPESIRAALEAYCNGATLLDLAKQYGVTRQAVYGWLLGELGGEQHTHLVTRALTARIAKGDEMLDTADNPLDLQRGREQARNARLDLERRRSNLYGHKQEVTVKTVDLGSVLDGQCERLLDKVMDKLGDAQRHAALLPSQVIDIEPEPTKP